MQSHQNTLSIMYFMNLVWLDRSTTFESLSHQSHVAWQSLSNLIAAELNSKV